jgi:hypothetical protein
LKEEESIKEGVYVPDGIVPVCQGGCLIQEGADNIDINTEIIDGKGSLSSTPITYTHVCDRCLSKRATIEPFR